MKRSKIEPQSGRRIKLSYIFLALGALYLILICVKFPEFYESATALGGDESVLGVDEFIDTSDDDGELSKRNAGSTHANGLHYIQHNNEKTPSYRLGYDQITSSVLKPLNMTINPSVLERAAVEACTLGLKAWDEANNYDEKDIGIKNLIFEGKPESCPSFVTMTGVDLAKADHIMLLPCGLSAGSSITVIGIPHYAHREYVPQLAKTTKGDGMVSISHFSFELQGLKAVVGEDPPKILHLNPRVRGDWSRRPVIEHNTCYRMQWGTSQRCDGIPSKSDEDMLVDGFLRCEKWMRSDIADVKESKIFSWFQRFIGRAKKPEVTWPFPFVEGKMFIMTVRAGIDGFHITIGGRHVTSFPYRVGFSLEDATGLAIAGDVDVHSVYATSLPTSHPSFSPQRVLDFSEKWKSLPFPLTKPIQLFIGILSATNHFSERMAIRKTWMQSQAIKSSSVVARFFVALVQNVTAAYVMKCDDDNFIRLDAVMKEIDRVSPPKSFYMGNLNLMHRPLRHGKWAVTFEEWPEDIYPPYANGPGYIISRDIAQYIVSEHLNNNLRLFKMEDVSMGMWVEKYNITTPVQYVHDWKFCQYGCMDNYITAHYQSPQQMFCLWDNLLHGQPHCCNF
ncbi:unnamed protein product [Cuscuta europaea]|uniref:Galectin domain-containing protein n=1 Tax=Cuscuta europaea TaxID=41803 RepID=A0A9P1A2D3_CUSEU|nr:unnamed protein product [Cuscuta europaea]